MKYIQIFLILLAGCVSSNRIPDSVENLHVPQPYIENHRSANEVLLLKVIKQCVWLNSEDVKVSIYIFEFYSRGEFFMGQLLGDFLYLSIGDDIKKCHLKSRSIVKIQQFYDSEQTPIKLD
ncbi:MAG: hypothetical protein HRT38_18835 [Alteromonadaceae bacterium]|nr:hypothetical protein [Alteromonadaceae bacterium]